MQGEGNARNERKWTAAEGILVRHGRSCAKEQRHPKAHPRAGERVDPDALCTCKPAFLAHIWSARDKKRITKTFSGKGALANAKAWRAEASTGLRKGTMRAPTATTLRDAAAEWLDGAEEGRIRNRSGERYKPSVIRSYRRALEKFLLPEFGAQRLSSISRADIQDFAEELLAEDKNASTVRNILMPARVIFRRAIERGELTVNPVANLNLPPVTGRRDRVASPTEAAQLVAALPVEDQALWALAFYGGLRRGELRALRWEHLDLARGVIRVEQAWDDVEGPIDPKSRKGTRSVPIVDVLRDYLTAHKARTGRDGRDFVFGARADRPFAASHARRRALRAWQSRFTCGCPVPKEGRLVVDRDGNAVCAAHEARQHQAITLHECRHTFVTLLHESGFSLEEIGDFVGHSSAYMTDHYRHLRAERLAEAAQRFSEYLARADSSRRVAQLEYR